MYRWCFSAWAVSCPEVGGTREHSIGDPRQPIVKIAYTSKLGSVPHRDSDSRVTSFVITTDLQNNLPDRYYVMMSALSEALRERGSASIRPGGSLQQDACSTSSGLGTFATARMPLQCDPHWTPGTIGRTRLVPVCQSRVSWWCESALLRPRQSTSRFNFLKSREAIAVFRTCRCLPSRERSVGRSVDEQGFVEQSGWDPSSATFLELSWTSLVGKTLNLRPGCWSCAGQPGH